MKSFSLFDRKVAANIKSFYSINAQTALRELAEVISRNELPHFQDLELFETGDQDDQTMFVVGLDAPKHLMNLGELAPVEAPNG